MSDVAQYFLAHAIRALRCARALPRGEERNDVRTVARGYRLLARHGVHGVDSAFLDAYRAERRSRRRPNDGAR